MDISANFDTIMLQYNKNMRDYNDNMRIYLQLFQQQGRTSQPQQRTSRQQQRTALPQPPIYTIPTTTINTATSRLLNSLFSNAFVRQTTREPDYQDVLVFPTAAEIDNATEIIEFYREDATHLNTSCPITLEPFIQGEQICRIKHCLHSFKQVAISDWFRRNVRCPVCRYDIRDYIADDETSEIDDTDDFNDVIDELIQESSNAQSNAQSSNVTTPSREEPRTVSRPPGIYRPQTRPQSTQSNFTQNLTQAIRNFVSSEIQHLPFDINSTAAELLYTFDIPLNFDISNNLR